MTGDGEEPRAKIAHYRDLWVYERSYQLALEIHRITQKFPAYERRELGSQLRRAAVSVPVNVAEGYGRKRFAEDFKRFLVISLGSCNEVAVLLDLGRDLGYLSEAVHTNLKQRYEEIGKGLHKLVQVWK